LRIFKRLAFAAAILTAVFCFGFTPVFAAADGVYLTATHTYYLNPDTGVTDDGGTKNAALGEGMCRSVIYEKALVEIDGGKVYATVRLQLMSNMRDFRLFVQNAPEGSYTKVTPRITAEDAGADTADYRFELPSVGAYISWEMYVIPMGRDVKFYMNLSESLSEGSGDFVVSLKPKAASSEPQAAEEGQAGTAEAQAAGAVTPAVTPAPEPSEETAATPPPADAATEIAAVTSAPAQAQTAQQSTAAASEIRDETGVTDIPASSVPASSVPASSVPAPSSPEAPVPSETSESNEAIAAVIEDPSGQGAGNGEAGGLNPILIIAAVILIIAAGASLWFSRRRRGRP
jgi:hypothetical protein